MGDIDCDGLDEVVIFAHDDTAQKVKGWAMDYDSKEGTYSEVETWSLNTTSDRSVMALGDFDGDGLVIGFTGNVTRTITDPRALVVMATPPVVEGIDQNRDKSGTAYGTEVFQGETRSHEVGSTASATVSYEAGDPFGIVSASVSATLSTEFSITETHESLETYGTSYESGYPDDVAIYEATMYENYIYEILAHPDPTLVGTFMTLDIPVTPDGPSIFKTTVDHFNHLPGASPIDRKTFTHRPGAVWSYPTVQEKNDLLMTYPGWESNLEYVGQGSATSTVTIGQVHELRGRGRGFRGRGRFLGQLRGLSEERLRAHGGGVHPVPGHGGRYQELKGLADSRLLLRDVRLQLPHVAEYRIPDHQLLGPELQRHARKGLSGLLGLRRRRVR